MAISKSASKTIYTSQNYAFTLSTSFTETSIDENTNKSIMTIVGSLGGKSAFDVSNAGVLRLYWHDNKTGIDTKIGELSIKQCGNSGDYQFGTKSITKTYEVEHNDDGTLSGYSIAKWTRGTNGNNYSHYVPASGTVSTPETELTLIEQGTLRIARNNAFLKAKAYIGVGGQWRLCRAYIGMNGVWLKGN